MLFVGLAVAAVASQAALTPVPPPPIVRTNSPPPVVIMPTAPPAPPMPVMRPDYVGIYDRPTITLRVRVSAGGTSLFDDRLRVGRAGATYNLTRSESSEPACNAPYPLSERNTFAISVRPDGPTRDHYRVSVSWSRPTPGCGTQGNRSVSLDQAVAVKTGQAVFVEGDAGLRVEIRRP